MKKFHVFVFALVIILALGLSACERSAVTALPDDGTNLDFPVPERTTNPMEELNKIATMTAMAASQKSPDQTPEATPIVSDPEVERTSVATYQPYDPKETAESPTRVPTGVAKDYPVPDTYTLESGEFLYCIARRFNIAPAAIISANNFGDDVQPGDVLTIPRNAPVYNLGPRALRTHPTTYVIQSGDTVNSIACLFGDVDPRNIKAINNISGTFNLTVGATIQIP